MSRETRHLLLKPLAGLVAIAFVAGLSLVDSAAAPASSGAAAKVVTISLSDRGKGTWSMAGDTEKGSLSLSYNWTGVVTLDVPATQLRNPTRGRLSARGTAVLQGSWSGDYSGTRFAGQPNENATSSGTDRRPCGTPAPTSSRSPATAGHALMPARSLAPQRNRPSLARRP